MPQKYLGRVILILAVLFLAVMAILPPFSLFDSSIPWSKKINLKPGIDMAGGTKLVYEIKVPEGGGTIQTNLAAEVMTALKKRVDPDGLRNLIWRPQSGNRLEIQMPLNPQSDQAQAIRVRFAEAQRQLDKTNVRRSDVLRAVEKLKGDARRERFNELAMGSVKRAELFGALASAYDQVKLAEATGDPRTQAEAEIGYEKLKNQVEDTNLSSTELQVILDDARAQSRQKRLDELKVKYAGFDRRLTSIDQFVTAYESYATIKDNVDDAAGLKRLLRGSGVLEFHMLVEPADRTSPEALDMVERLKTGGKGVTPQANDTMRWYMVDRPEDMSRSELSDYNNKKWTLAWTTPERSMVNRPGQTKWALESAKSAQTQTNVRAVGFRFDQRGAVAFGAFTANNKKHMMAVMLDDKVISAANINDVISREGIISRENGYSDDEFKYLISTLSAGSLPAQLAEEPISEQTVGPQIGSDNLRNGLVSCMLGLVVIGIFLIGYYHLAGVVAFAAVLMDVVLILGAMAAFNATFTLAGVAGIVLTICIAVDANVLVFERLREEQIRGLGIRMALRNAYDRAFSAILDSNVTTAITALILYVLGSEEVKGFGLTLLLGMLSSMFTALFVTKTVFALMTDRMDVKKLGSLPLSFPKWNRLLHPKIDWMSLFPIFCIFSVVSITIGLVAFGVQLKSGKMLDIEFASGTSVQVKLKTKMEIDQVRKAVDAMALTKPNELPAPSVVSLGIEGLEYEVVTPNANGKQVKDAVVAALGDNLLLERESKFDNVGTPLNVAMQSKAVLPITKDDMSIDGKPLDSAADYRGGVAIVLANLDPALSVDQIKARIEKQRLQPQANGQTMPYREMEIQVLQKGEGDLAKSVAVLISDAKYPYEKNAGDWEVQLAGPIWRLVNDAINNPAQLQKVTNFDAQVASATQAKAIFALALSTLVIMMYIWFRFGDMKFGSASVVATLHDALFMIGSIGLSHYVWDTSIGRWLMIEPFRMNLTMVAAILTVLGYSMNDTVVVFDRVREIRGKTGVMTRGLINDAINQTLSRTLLISVTAIVLVGIMYIYGGPGIHGFTFALLVGIIEGTYSSVAVAAPILMYGLKREKLPVSAPKADTTAFGK